MSKTRWEFSSDGFNWRTLAPGEEVPSGVRCRLVALPPPTGQLDGRHIDIAADMDPKFNSGGVVDFTIGNASAPLRWSYGVTPPAAPKRAPRWTATPRGHLMYDDLPVANLRYAAARSRIEFILAALNAAEEKR